MFSPGDVVLCRDTERATVIQENLAPIGYNRRYLVTPENRDAKFWKEDGRCKVGEYFLFSVDYLRLIRQRAPVFIDATDLL